MSDNPLNSETVAKPTFGNDQRTDDTHTKLATTKLAETRFAENELIHPGMLAILDEIEIKQEYYHACGRW